MINPAVILKIKSAKDKFTANHPKFIAFLKAVQQQGVKEGTVMDIAFTDADGKRLQSNIRLNAEDIEMLRDILSLTAQQQ